MRAPYRYRRDPRYILAWVVCRVREHRWEPIIGWTHVWCTRCGEAVEWPWGDQSNTRWHP